MVALPKNQALTMLLGGKVGFDDATSATVKNGAIFLASGVSPFETDGTIGYRNPTTPLLSNIQIGPGSYTSALEGISQGALSINATSGDATFGGGVHLESWIRLTPVSISLQASDGHQLRVAGNLDLYSEDFGTSGAGSGLLSIAANSGGSINVGGATTMNTAELGTANNISVSALDGGTITTGTLTLDAWAQGATIIGDAGDGQGGRIDVEAQNGGAIHVNGDLIANANGTGGNGSSSGGDGYGGQTNLYVYGGTLAVTGNVTTRSNGIGGNGLVGGVGVGGVSTASVAGSSDETGLIPGALTVGSGLTLEASGLGGNGVDNLAGTGGAGGDGYGGYASLYVGNYSSADESVTLSAGDVEILSNASGGIGGNGINGGAGGGGYAYGYYGDCTECGYYGSSDFQLYGGGATLGTLHVKFTSQGGAGGTGSTGVGGRGGDAYSGYSSVLVGGDLTSDLISAEARATGGNGGAGSTQGDGGYAEGGYVYADIYDGAQLNGNVNLTTTALGGSGNVGGDAYAGSSSLYVEGSLTSPSVLFDSSATGGAGVVAGGYGEGGDASIDVYGTANVVTNIGMNVNAAGGTASNGTGGDAYGGYADIYASDGGTLNGGALTVTANATAGTGTSNGYASGGSISLSSDDYETELPTAIAFDTITLTANTIGSGSVDYALGGDINIEAFGGSITADSLVATANGSTDGGYINFETWTDYSESPGQLQFGTINATANGGGSGGYISFSASGGSISADLIVATANGGSDGGFIAFQASGDSYDGSPGHLAFGSVDATANGGEFGGYIYAVTDSGGTIDLGDAQLRANGGSSGFVYLLAGCCGEGGGEGDFANQSAPLPTGGGIAASDLTVETSGDILLGLSNGADISVAGTFEADAGNTISMFDDGSGGAIRAHIIDFDAASIDANARLIGDIIGLHGSEYLNVSDVSASQSATFTTDGRATFTGVVSAPTITVTSSDIDIFDGASLGVFGTTNLITLNALSNGDPIVIGESEGGEGQYVLSDVEIETAALVINAIGGGEGGAPDVHIFNVEIDGSQTAGGGLRSVTLNTGGSVLVNGVINYANAGTNDSLTINAGETIAIDTDTGGIQITNPGGSLTGTLTLAADNIWAASGTLLDQLLANPNFEGRSAALAVNSGTANQDGFVRAGTVHAAVGNTLFVQNSGTPELFGGIDTGDGGLTIEGTGSSPATVIAFGRQTNADGTVLTNQDFIRSVETEGQVGFTEDSVVNGCFFGGSCGGGNDFEDPVLGVDMASILGPLDQGTSDDGTSDDDDDDSDESEDGSKADPSMRLINTTPINLEQQIDDPVTSGGDVVVGNPAN